MSVEAWTTLLVILSFILYLYIGWRSRVQDSKGFYVADRGIPAIANGAATAADWMSAAIFISLTYVAGQMRGVGIVFSRFLQVNINTGLPYSIPQPPRSPLLLATI